MSRNRIKPSKGSGPLLIGIDANSTTTSFATANGGNEGLISGELEFIGAKNKRSKFIKVPSDVRYVDEVYNHVTRMWGLETPKIIVSVTGGAQNFKMKPRLTRIFRKSLINLAESTGAWLVTGGTNYGVMKHVGKAVQEYAAVKSMDANKVVTLGIATWGIIHEREKILNEKTHNVSNPATGGVLDKNHSHFIMIDDGSQGKYGREIEFRATFEKHIAEKAHESKKILISCILVQGGPGSLTTVCEALKAKTPVVVVGGSGQWANILAFLCTNAETKVNQKVIANLLQENSMAWKTEEDLSKWTNMAEECVKRKNLITVFQLDTDTPDSVQELDVAILQSLLADQQQDEKRTEHQLELALAWNRSDIASTHILTDDCSISQKVLTELFVEAVKKDNASFVHVLLDYGLDLRGEFSSENLMDLYRAPPDLPAYCKKMLEKKCVENRLDNFDWLSLTNLMKKLLGPSYESKYSCMAVKYKLVYLEDPLREVFQWAVIMNRRELARVIWESMFDQLPAAVAATAMLRGLAKMTIAKASRDDLMEHAEDYVTATRHILTKCMKDDDKKTNQLLIRRLSKWGGLDCMQMAVDAASRDVVAHEAVQRHLTGMWKHGMNFTGWKGYLHLLSAVVFVLPLYSIDFEADDVSSSRDSASQTSLEGGSDGARRKKSKFLTFYRAPVTKYVVNVIFHLLFLMLFSYILLFNFFPHPGTITTLVAPSIQEWTLFAWTLILSIDEIHEMVRQKNKSLIQRVWFWFDNHWNKMDFVGLLLFVVGFIIRFTPNLAVARVILSLSFIVYCIRLLHVFTLSQTIGPKVVMVGNMLRDLWFFVFIVAMFLFAYGVTSQGMLYPNETRVRTAIIGIFYKPYWQIYGELFLDEINYDPTSSAFECTNNQTLLDAGYQRCPEQQDVVPVISAFYMLLANILLLNLLIAMFSYTFSKLEDNTESIWKFQRYELIEEYRTRPALPAPFSIFWYMVMAARYCLLPGEREEMPRPDVILSKFEQWNTDIYLSEKRAEEARAVPTRIQGLNDRLDSVQNSIEGFVEHFSRQKKISKRVKQLEANLVEANESLRWLIQAMQDNGTMPKTLDQNVHEKALTSPYPGSNISRFPVEVALISWTVPMASYKPKFYTASSVLANPPWADPPLEGTVVEKRPRFNAYDREYKVDRTSYLGNYVLYCGLPRNPMGRTGVTGRGLLGRYGPNHAADPIVTRWEKGADGRDLEIDGKRVLEFIAIKREDTGDWAIPGGMVDPGEKVSRTLLRELQEEVKFGDENMEEKKVKELRRKLVNFLKQNGVEVFRGYADDHRNTDNSWIESVAMNFHDDTGDVLGQLVVSPGYEAKGAKWKRIEKSLKLFASHQSYIEKVAEMRKAYF